VHERRVGGVACAWHVIGMPRAKSEASTAKRQRWTREQARVVLEKHASSGLTVREFAERERLEPARLYRWRERLSLSTGQQLAASAASRPERAAFVEVRAHRPSRIELVLRTGHVLFVPDSFDPSALSRLVEILERAAEC
jgi:transposase